MNTHELGSAMKLEFHMLSSILPLKPLQAGVTHHTAGPGTHPLDTLWYSYLRYHLSYSNYC